MPAPKASHGKDTRIDDQLGESKTAGVGMRPRLADGRYEISDRLHGHHLPTGVRIATRRIDPFAVHERDPIGSAHGLVPHFDTVGCLGTGRPQGATEIVAGRPAVVLALQVVDRTAEILVVVSRRDGRIPQQMSA